MEDERSTLPTDFIFDLGPRQLKFHVPVKISTRERAVQVWAHQRMLNGVYGEGRFKGVLVALAETKLDLQKLEVVEICLPDQWAVTSASLPGWTGSTIWTFLPNKLPSQRRSLTYR